MLCISPNVSEKSEDHRSGMWSVNNATWKAFHLEDLKYLLVISLLVYSNPFCRHFGLCCFCSTLLSLGPSSLELKKRSSCFVADLVFILAPSTSVVFFREQILAIAS